MSLDRQGTSPAPERLVGFAIEIAEEALAAGELPIGAVVVMDGEIVGRAYTQEQTLSRRLVHADLLAMIEADQLLGWRRRTGPLTLAVTLEPCLMCLGAAMTLGVTQIWYGLESPSDGATDALAQWEPQQPGEEFARVPAIGGGILRQQCREQFERYAAMAKHPGMRRWASDLASLPEHRHRQHPPGGE